MYNVGSFFDFGVSQHLDKSSQSPGENPLVSSVAGRGCGETHSGEQCGCTVACDGSNVSLMCAGGGWVEGGGPPK